MLEYIYRHDDLVTDFVVTQLPVNRNLSGKMVAIGVAENGELIAGIVYHNYSTAAGVIEITVAALPGKNWFTRETIRRMYAYPFLQMQCQMVMTNTPAHDERTLRMLASLGHMFVRVPRLRGPTEDAILCLLTREDWQANKIHQRLWLQAAPKQEAA